MMKILMAIFLVWMTAPVMAACNLNIAQYVSVEIESRQHTVDGMAQRLMLLQQQANMDLMYEADWETAQKVNAVFARYDCSPAEHARFGVVHEGDIAVYLLSHPESQARLEHIQAKFNQYTQSIRAIQPETVSAEEHAS
ncbi:hypothetical protein [Photobacterium sp. 1_MG-2023]|uniref:hypothetical protein n=1 Tax=Photobacterium sp. 1_MG-2023 TaxID=3062646 RepID=UPI0026E1CCFD|nr:hypothetical protein [Photobacterium sp. 1_MG-2023]MDO6705956.1 hypothetical protein [Photobacterium sp. 1_MG-2023]